MPSPDEDLRKLFREGREEDRDLAPSFQKTWDAAERSRPSRRYAALGLAAAAVVLLAAGWLLSRGPDPVPVPERPVVAETNPLPDLPESEEPDDDVSMGLAAWEPETFASPTDFPLDDDSALAGGLPSSDFDDHVLDLDDLTMEL